MTKLNLMSYEPQGALERIKNIKCFLFDMDGTIFLGDTLIPGMDTFFDKLKASGRDYYMLTNNSSKSHEHYLNKLARLGVPATRENVMISTDAFTNYIQKTNPQARLFVLGTPSLEDNIRKAGLTMTNTLEKGADLVVVGFDMTLTYEKLAIACRLIDRGVPYVATHPDVRCPIENNEFLPDTGAMLRLIETATGKKCSRIFGKPYKYMIDVALDRTGYKKEEIAMVGDRLSTDIAFGVKNEILSIMVLTGEAKLPDIESENIWPDVILPKATYILDYLK